MFELVVEVLRLFICDNLDKIAQHLLNMDLVFLN